MELEPQPIKIKFNKPGVIPLKPGFYIGKFRHFKDAIEIVEVDENYNPCKDYAGWEWSQQSIEFEE